MAQLAAYQTLVIKLTVLYCLLQLLNIIAYSQSSMDKQATTVGSESQRLAQQDEQKLKWKAILDNVSAEVGSITQDNLKPYAMAQIAEAYWHIDQETSKGLFMNAFERASSLDPKYPDRN